MSETHPIRLACAYCSRDDYDGITEADLERLKAEGWTNITSVQTYEESRKTYARFEDAPPGFDVTAWYTHLAVCPDCNKDQAEEEQDAESIP
jgi:hypothetical protein